MLSPRIEAAPWGAGTGWDKAGLCRNTWRCSEEWRGRGCPGEERLLGASSRKIRHLGHAPEPGCAKTSLLPGRGRGKQGCPGATRCSPKAPQPPKGSPRPPGKHPPRCGRCRRGDSVPACGCGERSSAPTGRAPGAGAALAPLPADGLLDGPLLQVDVVVEGGGALVIVSLQEERGGGEHHPCEPSCPSPRRGSPLSGLIRGWGLEPWRLHPAGSWLCQTLSISQPKHLPGAGGEGAPLRGHPPCGPGRCAQPSSSSAAGGCRCQISCSAGCTRGSPACACCRGTDNGLSTRPLSIRTRLGAKISAPQISPVLNPCGQAQCWLGFGRAFLPAKHFAEMLVLEKPEESIIGFPPSPASFTKGPAGAKRSGHGGARQQQGENPAPGGFCSKGKPPTRACGAYHAAPISLPAWEENEPIQPGAVPR